MSQCEKPIRLVVRLTLNGLTVRRFAVDENQASKIAIQLLHDYPCLLPGDMLHVVAFPEIET